MLALLQKDPAGQGFSALVPAGQYAPVLQGLDMEVFPGQKLPAGQTTGEATTPAQVKPGRQKAHTVFDVSVHTLTLYLPAGHELQLLQTEAPATSV